MENINAFFSPLYLKNSGLPLQNFHLMDYHLAIFITVMLARRLVWTIVSEVNTLYPQLTHFSTHSSCGTQTPLMAVPQSFC